MSHINRLREYNFTSKRRGLETFLCEISMDGSNDLKFILYGLISVADKNTMKDIIMQQNNFIEEMTIVTVQGINHKN